MATHDVPGHIATADAMIQARSSPLRTRHPVQPGVNTVWAAWVHQYHPHALQQQPHLWNGLTEQARLQRNRESAQLSRQRKKSQLDDLDRKCRSFQAQNQELHVLVARLAAENQTLRSQLQRYQGHQVRAAPAGVGALWVPVLAVRTVVVGTCTPSFIVPSRAETC